MVGMVDEVETELLRVIAEAYWRGFARTAWGGFSLSGRGAVVLSRAAVATAINEGDADAALVFVPLAHLRALSEEVMGAVTRYDPERQVVVMIVNQRDVNHLQSAVAHATEAVLEGTTSVIVAQHLPPPPNLAD